MGNIMLGFPNRIDGAGLSGGAWVASLPLANLKNRQLARVARSADLAAESTLFDIDLGQPRRTRIMALVAHNCTFYARWRIRASVDAAMTQVVHDTGWRDVWGEMLNLAWNIDELEWENDGYWYGTYTAEQIDGMTPVGHHLMTSEVFARYWRVEILDGTNPAGYVEIGRVFIGDVVQPKVNYSWGAGLGYETATSVETALSGAEFFEEREPVRVFAFQLQFLDDADGFGVFLDLQRQAGVSREIFVVPDPDDILNAPRRNFLGRIRTLSRLEQALWADGGSAHTLAFEIKELR